MPLFFHTHGSLVRTRPSLCSSPCAVYSLFAKTTMVVGMKGVCATLTRTLPSLMLVGSVGELAIIEFLNLIVWGKLHVRETGGRPLIIATMIATLLAFCVGFFTPRRVSRWI